MYEDKILTCRECGAEFTFSASEQEFYASKGFQNQPSRCPACRAARRANGGNAQPRGERQMYEVICDGCGCKIEKIRLKALPFAKTCIRCQSEMENQNSRRKSTHDLWD